MWAAIKGDVSEFISTVKTETAETLNKIDHNLDGDDAPSTPMIDPDTGIVIDDENETVADTSFSREEMLHYIHSCPQVFMDPLPKQEEDENENESQPEDQAERLAGESSFNNESEPADD